MGQRITLYKRQIRLNNTKLSTDFDICHNEQVTHCSSSEREEDSRTRLGTSSWLILSTRLPPEPRLLWADECSRTFWEARRFPPARPTLPYPCDCSGTGTAGWSRFCLAGKCPWWSPLSRSRPACSGRWRFSWTSDTDCGPSPPGPGGGTGAAAPRRWSPADAASARPAGSAWRCSQPPPPPSPGRPVFVPASGSRAPAPSTPPAGDSARPGQGLRTDPRSGRCLLCSPLENSGLGVFTWTGRKEDCNRRDSVGERLVHSRLTPRVLTAVIPWKGEGVRHWVDN